MDAAMMQVVELEALYGVPDFMDVPDELKERLFWLSGTHLTKDLQCSVLLRRAVYAESRCWEMENQAAEMGLICGGAAEKIKELEAKIAKLEEVLP